MTQRPLDEQRVRILEHEVRTLERCQCEVERRLFFTRLDLYAARAGQLPSSSGTTNAIASFLGLMRLEPQIGAGTPGDVQNIRPTCHVEDKQTSTLPKSPTQPPDQSIGTFVSLKIDPVIFKYHVNAQNWSTEICSSQGPECEDSARFRPLRTSDEATTREPSQLDYVNAQHAQSCASISQSGVATSTALSTNHITDHTTKGQRQPAINGNAAQSATQPTANTQQSHIIAPSMTLSSAPFNFLSFGQPNVAASIPNSNSMPSPRPASSLSQNDDRTYTHHDAAHPHVPLPRPASAVSAWNLAQGKYSAAQAPHPRMVQNPFMQHLDTSNPLGVHMPLSASTPGTNMFYQAAGVQGSPTGSRSLSQQQLAQRYHAQILQQRNDSQRHNTFAFPSASLGHVSTISTPHLGSGLSGRGLTKKTKHQPDLTVRAATMGERNIDNNQYTLQRKRSPSLEMIDRRPRQRSRNEPDQVMTPPLNPNDADDMKFERLSNIDRSSPSRQSASSNRMNEETALRRRQAASWQPPQGTSSGYPSHAPTRGLSRRQLGPACSDEEVETSPDHSQRQKRRSGTPAVIAEGRKSPSITDHRPVRHAARRPAGAYRTAVYKPLTPSERINLELRYCAYVAKIISSKKCVSMPPFPHDSVSIFHRLRGRFRTNDDDDFTDDHYRSATDFVTDAKSILELYVRMGHCPDCPFLKSGNARVMCYRMRLASILEDRMRGLKECLQACEYDCDGSDPDARIKKVDEWFHVEDFDSESHWTGN